MEQFLLNNGLPALFLLSFLAATVLPVGSEWLVVALILNLFDPGSVVFTATIGNFLGACTTYGIGFFGAAFLLQKFLRIDAEQTERATALFRSYGSWTLLLSWLPIIGDPLCLVAGYLRFNFLLFSFLVLIGKLGRYAVIAAVTTGSMS
ncbi:DedA family protein [Desulfotalea psychrophila]|jgi:membrane protein YqaA with SNARE-associated domain|uniref:DedA family protein n=1 Tax=Desulfotalea psychrophila TaxID=84980 RepID=A0ABS3ATT0_9BACT|nr:DedA family protein [Desulfocapsa sp.]MBN4048879.1 DedA family protein [bacterium AH-315-N22]MBN4068153.1 DedA family protein [Desulfotalea psychrophila]MBN4071676.1 DedA family protein [Desulfotalea psychrophila]